jgi:hypothetical protein
MNDKERLMTREERQRAMEFIVQQQAKNEVELERINESFRKADDQGRPTCANPNARTR